MNRKSRVVRFKNRIGLHMRPASEVVRIASAYEAEIHFSVADSRVNARSIFGLLTLGVMHGDLLEVTAVGHDADAALDALGRFLASDNDAHRERDHDSDAA